MTRAGLCRLQQKGSLSLLQMSLFAGGAARALAVRRDTARSFDCIVLPVDGGLEVGLKNWRVIAEV